MPENDYKIGELKYKRGCSLMYEATNIALQALMSEHVITNTNLQAVDVLSKAKKQYEDIMASKCMRITSKIG